MMNERIAVLGLPTGAVLSENHNVMLVAKKCAFCGLAFVNADGRNSEFCPKCSGTRRKLAAEYFLAASGRPCVVGNYLLSEKQAKGLGVFRTSL
jgi:hypothetical protein